MTNPRDRPAPAPDFGRTVRRVAWAMAAALAALVAVALLVRPLAATPMPFEVAAILAGLGAVNLVVGLLLAVTADPAAPAWRARAFASLALRESAGLLGVVPTLLGAGPVWALALGGAAIASLVLLPVRR